MSNKGITYRDLEDWTWEDVEKFNALLDMEADHTAAWRAMIVQQNEAK